MLFVCCGLLSYAAAPTHGFGFLAFFSLIPLFHAAYSTRTLRETFIGGYIAGAVFFIPALAWMIPVTVAGWLALSLYCAVYFALFALAVRWTSRLSTLWTALALSSTWILLEYVRGIAFTGFPWLLLSHTQYQFTPFVQTLDVIGALGLSGVIVTINVLLYKGWQSRQLRPALLAGAILGTGVIYGYARMGTIRLRPSLYVAAIQAAVPQEMKETLNGTYDPEEVLKRYITETAQLSQTKTDLIVWPETVFIFPYTLNVNPDALEGHYAKYAREAQSAMRNIAQAHSAYMLAGASTYLPAEMGYVADAGRASKIPAGAWDQRYNSAILVNARGDYVDRYDKMHLVPFGEYIPLPNVLPFLARFIPFDESLIAGQQRTIFKIPHGNETAKFGVLICYEDADADMARRLRQDGADFMVNLSNDAWFGASELGQHFVSAQFRAIENRMGVLRNGNNGITGIIDPFGRVVGRKVVLRDVIGHLEGRMIVTDAHSLYSRFGDFPIVAAALFFLALSVIKCSRSPE